jgi:anti-sigma regulatory factor (Ser/Thr protein kinase)
MARGDLLPSLAAVDGARDLLELTTGDLWLAYLALGGNCSAGDLTSWLEGSAEPSPAEYRVLQHALAEALAERSLSFPVPAELGPSAGLPSPRVVDIREVLARSPLAPRASRRFTERCLASIELAPGTVERVRLAVSELVTNVVVHTDSDPVIEASLHRPSLLFGVSDRSAAVPVHRERPSRPGGHGIRVVATVSDRWGTLITETGKCVWVEFDRSGAGRTSTRIN